MGSRAPLSLAPGAVLSASTAQLSLMRRLRPHVLSIARRSRETGRFGAAVLAELRAHPWLERVLSVDAAAPEETFTLRRSLLLPRRNPPLDVLRLGRRDLGRHAAVELGEDAPLAELQGLFSRLASGRHSRPQLESGLSGGAAAVLKLMVEMGLAAPVPAPRRGFAQAAPPGVYRLQHASLLYRTRRVGILTDPHLHSAYEPRALRRSVWRRDLEGSVDAVLISHSHADHYDLTTLMSFPRDLLIVVPRVPRPSLLCEDMESRLRGLGFTNVQAPAWHGPPLKVGDAEVHVLPFYGEQPLIDGPARSPHLRNWGNTYVVRAPDYTSWFIIDSGDDHLGTAQSLGALVRRKFGGVDFLLSNLRVFEAGTPAYIMGNGEYWLSLPNEKMRRFEELRRMSVTLGPEKVARLCAVAGARAILPYAHLFGNLGEDGSDERYWVARLDAALEREGRPARLLRWGIGEGYAAAGGRPRRVGLDGKPEGRA